MEVKLSLSLALTALVIHANIHTVTPHHGHFLPPAIPHEKCEHSNAGLNQQVQSWEFKSDGGFEHFGDSTGNRHIQLGAAIGDDHAGDEEGRTFGHLWQHHFGQKPLNFINGINHGLGVGVQGSGAPVFGGSPSIQGTGHFEQQSQAGFGFGGSDLHAPTHPGIHPGSIHNGNTFGSSGTTQWSQGSSSHGQNGFGASAQFGGHAGGHPVHFPNTGHGIPTGNHGGSNSASANQGTVHTQTTTTLTQSPIHGLPNLTPVHPGFPPHGVHTGSHAGIHTSTHGTQTGGHHAGVGGHAVTAPPAHGGHFGGHTGQNGLTGTVTQTVIQTSQGNSQHGFGNAGHTIPTKPIETVHPGLGSFQEGQLVPAKPIHQVVTEHHETTVTHGNNGLVNHGPGSIPTGGLPLGGGLNTISSESSQFSSSNSSSSSSTSSSSSFSSFNSVSSSSSSGGINTALNTGNSGHGFVQNGAGLHETGANHVNIGSHGSQTNTDVPYGATYTETTSHFQTDNQNHGGNIHGGSGTSGFHGTVHGQVTVDQQTLNQNAANEHHNSGSSQTQEVHQVHQEQEFTGYPESIKPDVPFVTGNFRCHEATQICVAQNSCQHGFVTVEAGFLVNEQNQLCDVGVHVCCSVKYQQQTQQHVTVIHETTSQGEINQGGAVSNGYLPPPGPAPVSEPPLILPPLPPPPPPKPHTTGHDQKPTHVHPQVIIPAVVPPPTGCAAALLCVEEQYCTQLGVISKTPVILSDSQRLNRVPIVDCKNPHTGILGKCCRDPDYVDPWPAGGLLPVNYTGGFDQKGFPLYLNLGNKPAQQSRGLKASGHQQNVVNLVPVPTAPSHPLPTHHQPTAQPTPAQSHFPHNDDSSEVAEGHLNFESKKILPNYPQSPQHQPSNVYRTTPRPPQRGLPAYPSPRPVPAASNRIDLGVQQKAVSIAAHTPGAKCGIVNQVQQPGLREPQAAFGEIPWEAMILQVSEKKLLCSGAIVAPNLVLTAANCFEGINPADVAIKAGEYKLGFELKHEEPYPFEIVKVSSIVTHPNYQQGAAGYDLALLYLEHPIKLDQHVDTICVSSEAPIVIPGRKCISAGWGKEILKLHAAGAVQNKIDVDVLSQDECNLRLANAESRLSLHENLVCTKAHKQSNNMCMVDPGGPLACQRLDGSYEIVGVYSHDTGCLPTNQVATFAMIDANWVNNAIQGRVDQVFTGSTDFPTDQGDDQPFRVDPSVNTYIENASTYVPPSKRAVKQS